jgi:hypothetical protein
MGAKMPINFWRSCVIGGQNDFAGQEPGAVLRHAGLFSDLLPAFVGPLALLGGRRGLFDSRQSFCELLDDGFERVYRLIPSSRRFFALAFILSPNLRSFSAFCSRVWCGVSARLKSSFRSFRIGRRRSIRSLLGLFSTVVFRQQFRFYRHAFAHLISFGRQ